MTTENCELLNKAKALATEEGLDSVAVNCPIMDYCNGNRCILMETLEKYRDVKFRLKFQQQQNERARQFTDNNNK